MGRRVAIIGAGCAGLSMCKALVNKPKIQHVVFEKTNNIGGTWVYTEDKRQNNHCTAMYKNLRTNLPKEIMAYPEFPFPDGLPSFVRHEVVLKYLEDYADHFGLRKNVRFEHEVISVKPVHGNESNITWKVVVENRGAQYAEIFDDVVVCTGHFSESRIPEVPGLENFPGIVMHSLFYSEPTKFKDKTVIILGGKSSALDLCTEISSVAKKVYLVHYGEKVGPFPENVDEIIGTLTRGYDGRSFEISNKCQIFGDAIIFCTGYNYEFPFLTPECKVKVVNNRVTSLYKHVFNTAYPTLSFVGLCLQFLPFSNVGLQSQWIASVLTGRKAVPSSEEMIKDEERDYQERLNSGLRESEMHTLGIARNASYNNELAQLAGVPSLPPSYFSLHDYIYEYRKNNHSTFRDITYHITENEWFTVDQ